MAHFNGSMQGNRGEATRSGTKKSGFTAHIRGWNIGVRITFSHVNGKDVCDVKLTGGSNDLDTKKHIGTFVEGGE